MTVESVARGPKGNLHFLTGVHELCECSFILLFLGATEAEVCDVLGIAAAFADKEGGHRHSSDDICHPCKVPVVQDFGESDMENEWNSRKSRAPICVLGAWQCDHQGFRRTSCSK